MEVKRWELMPHVYLTYLPARKFKTGDAVAPNSSRRWPRKRRPTTPCCRRCCTAAPCAARTWSSSLRPWIGSTAHRSAPPSASGGRRSALASWPALSTTGSSPGDEPLLEPAAELLGELLLDPVTRGGRFLQEYVEGEKANLADAIRSIRNDKRDWADLRLLQEMCAGEPYGISRFGDEAGLARINNQKLYAHSQRMMSSSRLELFYCGSAECHRVEEALLTAFSSLTRGPPNGTGTAPTVRRSRPAPTGDGGDGRDAGQALHGLPLRYR